MWEMRVGRSIVAGVGRFCRFWSVFGAGRSKLGEGRLAVFSARVGIST